MMWAVWFPKTKRQYIEAETPGDALRAFLGTKKKMGGGYVQLLDCIPPGAGEGMIMRCCYCEQAEHALGFIRSPVVYLMGVR